MTLSPKSFSSLGFKCTPSLDLLLHASIECKKEELFFKEEKKGGSKDEQNSRPLGKYLLS